MHDSQLLIGDGGSVTVPPSASLALPDRMATLQAWEEAWNPIGASGKGAFWCKRCPDLRITLPPWQPAPSSPRATRLRATILDPDPTIDPFSEGLQELAEMLGISARDRFSFGRCFITSTRIGFRISLHPSYSYLDLHGHLGGTGTGTGTLKSDGIQRGEEDADVDADYDHLDWVVVDIPLWNLVEIALSAELDLAVAISCVFPWQYLIFLVLFFFHIVGPKTNRAIFESEGQEEETSHLTIRPLRFRDGTPHPYAMVSTMRLSVTGTSASQMTQAQVLGDYLLLWIAGASERRHSVAKIYVIAWKQGSITLVSYVFLIHDHLSY